MKQYVKLPQVNLQGRLIDKFFTVALAAFATVVCLASAQSALAQSDDFTAKHFVAPNVFQAAGPSPASIQSTVDQFRAALGTVNNGNNPGQASGRREINWDGGNPSITTTPVGATPFTVFLNTRGANITKRGSSFVQATPAGLADTYGN
jgi:hypothetical protein